MARGLGSHVRLITAPQVRHPPLRVVAVLANSSSFKGVSNTNSTTLETWLSNAFYDLVIQDQDDVAEITFDRAWSQKVKEL